MKGCKIERRGSARRGRLDAPRPLRLRAAASVTLVERKRASRPMRRLLFHGGPSAIALIVALSFPTAAAAHSGVTRGTDYRSRVLESPAGVAARMIGGDDRLVVRRTGNAVVLVLGYQSEQYLRLDAGGVWRNERSPAVLLNGVRRPTLEGIKRAERTAHLAPLWRRLGGGDTVVFHDHRTHWMSSSPPLDVRAHPREPAKVFDWAVPVRVAGRPSAIRGSLFYVPPPSRWWWLACAAAVVLGATGGAVLAGRGGFWPVVAGCPRRDCRIGCDRRRRRDRASRPPDAVDHLGSVAARGGRTRPPARDPHGQGTGGRPPLRDGPCDCGRSACRPSSGDARPQRDPLGAVRDRRPRAPARRAGVRGRHRGRRRRARVRPPTSHRGRDDTSAARSNEARPLTPSTKHGERTHR